MSRVFEILLRGARLRCPCCGYGLLFRSGFTMYERCTACDESFEREPGQGFGAIYINLGLTGLLTISGLLTTQFLLGLTMGQQLIIWGVVAMVAPFVFFRFATGLWTSLVFLGEGLYLDWPNH
jgi:uncharacterized protein (DUF983 family)